MNWLSLHNNYILHFYDLIHTLTTPLKDFFDIDFFGYHKITMQGKYIALINRPDWTEYYIEKKLYKNDPYLNFPDKYKEGLHFFIKDNDHLKKGLTKVGIDQGIIFIKKENDFVECFIFATSNQSDKFHSLYLNHSKMLHSFSNYFKKKVNPILLKQSLEEYSIVQLSNSNNNVFSQISKETKISFLSSIGLKKICMEAESLSLREKQCLKYLISGQSIKKIASHLMISPRTVESYLNNIKNKLSCWKKDDLVEKASLIDQIDLLKK